MFSSKEPAPNVEIESRQKNKPSTEQLGCLCCLDYLPLGPNPIAVLQLSLYVITIVVGLFACIPAGILIVSLPILTAFITVIGMMRFKISVLEKIYWKLHSMGSDCMGK